METRRVRLLAETSMFVALSLVLSYLKIYQLPYGGSITLGSMVPILLLAFRWGLRVGVFGGAVFGLAKMVLDGWVYNPLGMFLDYPLAFGLLGIAALFRERPLLGVGVSVITSAISGVFAPYQYLPKGLKLFSKYYPPSTSISALIYLLLGRRSAGYNPLTRLHTPYIITSSLLLFVIGLIFYRLRLWSQRL